MRNDRPRDRIVHSGSTQRCYKPGLTLLSFSCFTNVFLLIRIFSEMKTTLFFLHAISCCWLAGATLSKTDAKKPHKAEVEVS